MQEFTMKLTECLSCHWLYEIRTTNIHVNISELSQLIWARMPQLFLDNQILFEAEKTTEPWAKDQGPVYLLELYNLQFFWIKEWTYNEEMRDQGSGVTYRRVTTSWWLRLGECRALSPRGREASRNSWISQCYTEVIINLQEEKVNHQPAQGQSLPDCNSWVSICFTLWVLSEKNCIRGTQIIGRRAGKETHVGYSQGLQENMSETNLKLWKIFQHSCWEGIWIVSENFQKKGHFI